MQVLFVTLVIDRMLRYHEQRDRMSKVNMVIGAFFSEMGGSLLRTLAAADPCVDELHTGLVVRPDWTRKEFAKAMARLKHHDCTVDISLVDLLSLRDALVAKRDFMVRLLENPILLEHELFTDLLWAVFHLTEELASRPGFEDLPQSDLDHLGGDATRAYGTLVRQWLDYLVHLKERYPYLFSLAVRTNPFNRDSSVIVR